MIVRHAPTNLKPQPLAKAIQILFAIGFVLWLVWSITRMVAHREAFSSWSDHFFANQALLILQLLYPLYAMLSRTLAWRGPWRALRLTQAIAVALIYIGIALLFLTTPDVSGFSS